MEKQKGTPLVRYQKKQLMEVIIAAFITQVLFPYLKKQFIIDDSDWQKLGLRSWLKLDFVWFTDLQE